MKALGMIEVYGRIGAIEGLDGALKAANVSLVNMVRVGGGLTATFVEGDVGAVKAAIDAAAAACEKVGQLRSAHVIPRPAEEVREMLDIKYSDEFASSEEPCEEEKATEKVEETVTENISITKIDDGTTFVEEVREVEEVVESGEKRDVKISVDVKEIEEVKPAQEKKVNKKPKTEKKNGEKKLKLADLDIEHLKTLNVGSLRKVARNVEDLPMTKQEIKFAKRDQLIEAMSQKK